MNTPTYKGTSDRKRLFVETADHETFPVTIVKNMVTVETYGVKIVFRKSNRGSMVYDSRTPKQQISTDEAKSELVRMLGIEQGNAAYRELVA